MTVEPLVPDAASPPAVADQGPLAASASAPNGFARALDALGAVLNQADAAEDSFAAGRGSLQDAMYDRARADVALSVAVAAAQRCAQAAQAVLNMQV